jgi:hypothetical protein
VPDPDSQNDASVSPATAQAVVPAQGVTKAERYLAKL